MPKQPAYSWKYRVLATGIGVLTCLYGLTGMVKSASANAPDPGAAVGSIAGEFAVSGGAANYTIPIQEPEAPGGMALGLSLSYSSNGGTGPLGTGWSLNGLSVIHRCGRARHLDGDTAGIQWIPQDRYCVDGKRLVAVSGAYGADGTEYRTLDDGQARFFSHGVASTGPLYFTANTKSGETLHYGYAEQARIGLPDDDRITAWAIDRVMDGNQSAIVVAYAQETAHVEFRAARIDYMVAQPGAGDVVVASVVLEYVAHDGTPTRYVSGLPVKSTHVMSSIRLLEGGQEYKRYQLAYQPDDDIPSRLSSIELCVETACYPPTVFSWSEDPGAYAIREAFETVSSSFPSYGTHPKRASAFVSGDFNADGYDDVLTTTIEYPITSNVLYLSSEGADVHQISLGSILPAAVEQGVVDVNGDGMQDIVYSATVPSSSVPKLYVMKSSGQGFHPPEEWGAGVEYARVQSGRLQWSHVPQILGYGDIDGDGLGDVLTPGAAYFSTGTSFSRTEHGGTLPSDARMCDLNADGYQDVLWVSSRQFYVRKGNLTGFGPTENWGSIVSSLSGKVQVPYPFQLMDYDGDGDCDAVTVKSETLNYAYLSDGAGFTRNAAFSLAYDSLQALDFDGDGLTDIAIGDASQLRVSRGVVQMPSRIERIDPGLGESITVQYADASDAAFNEPAQGAVHPQLPQRSKQWLVKEYRASSSEGEKEHKTFRYGGALVDRDIGPLGFGWDEVTDQLTGISTRTEYSQAYPTIGMVTRLVTRQPNGNVISQSDSVYLVNESAVTDSLPTTFGANRSQTYVINFPYLSEKVETSYELDESLISTVTTKHEGYDAYGNVGKVTVATSDGVETHYKITENVFENDAVAWQLGRLTEATVTHIHRDGSQTTRKSRFAYDHAKGLLTSEIIEPDHPELRQITTYLYDDFGYKDETTVSGLDVASRTSRTTYDSSGRFPTSVTNAANHAETRVFNLYPHCGQPDQLIGPNGLITRWEYDGFCRKTKEIRADGTDASWTRQWVDFATDEDAPDNAVYYVEEATSGKPPVTKYHDVLGRVVRAVSTGFDGRAVYQDTVYDARGRELKSSLPYYKGDVSYWVETEYDILDRVTRKVFNTGKQVITTNYTYEGLSTTETNALGQQKTTTKNALGKVVRVDEEEGAYITYEYDPVGNLTSTHQGDGITGTVVTTRMGYDLRGRKIWMQDPDMSAATCNPDAQPQLLTGCWQYQYNAFGELIAQTDAKGQTVVMTYDTLGRMETRDELEGTTAWTYDEGPMAVGKLAVVEQRDALGDLLFKQESGYDAYGRPYTSTTTIPRDDGTSDVFTTAVHYDLFGRVEFTEQPGGFELHNRYDPVTGYLVAKQSPLPHLAAADSAYVGHLDGLLADAGTSAAAALDKADWYASQAAYFEAKADEYSTIIAAQAQTQELAPGAPALEDPRGYLTYTDAGGMLYAETEPTYVILHGSVATPIMVAPEQHYQLIQDAGGQWTVMTIDHASWQTLKSSLTTDGNKLHVGDFDANGVPDFRHVAADSAAPLFDDPTLNKLNSLAADIREAGRILANRADHAIAVAEQLIVAATHVRDRQRQAEYWASASGAELTAMTDDAGADMVTWWRATARDAAGRLSAHRLGNGLVELRDYDPATGHLNAIQTGFGFSDLLRQLDYEYDALNNVTARYDDFQNVREEFEYDRLNRLVTARVRGYAVSTSYEDAITYAYDALGNMTHKSDVGSYAYGDSFKANTMGAGPHAVRWTESGGEYAYDANGSVTHSNGRDITWTSFNKPARFEKAEAVVEFNYGPDRARYQKTATGIQDPTTTLYIGEGYERVEDATGNLTHKYFIHTEDGVTAIHVRHENASGVVDLGADQTRYLHRDALGSIDTITTELGTVLERMSYSPFGARRSGNWEPLTSQALSLYTNRGFTGHEHIDEMGLIHMNGRVYDPEIGRFLSADPIIQAPHASQNYNRYSYVLNNPLKYTDPSGHIFGWLFAAVVWLAESIAFYTALEIVVATALASAIVYGAAIGFALGTGFALANGVPIGKALGIGIQSALWGGLTGAVAFGVGHGINWAGMGGFGEVARAVTHGAAQGLVGLARGSKFKGSFFAGAFGSLAGSYAGRVFGRSWLGSTSQGKLLVSAVVGGTASEIGGGKFANGAISGAFVYLFNECGNGCDWEEGWDRVDPKDLRVTHEITLSRVGVAKSKGLKTGFEAYAHGKKVITAGAWIGGSASTGDIPLEPSALNVSAHGGFFVDEAIFGKEVPLAFSANADIDFLNARASAGAQLGGASISTESSYMVPPKGSLVFSVFGMEVQFDYKELPNAANQ